MKKYVKYKQRLKLICLIFFVVNFCFSSIGFVGWHRVGDKMSYLTNDGYRIANGWRESDGMRFYLDSDGYVVYNKVFDYNGNIYYVGENGARVENRFVDVTEDLILGDDIKPGLFYFAENGKAYRKIDRNFSKVINGKKFAFDEEGHVVFDCWLTKDGEIITDASSIIEDGYYRVKSDGTLAQNEWYNFTFDDGSDADLPESKMIADKYDDLNTLWMYFDNKGAKYISRGETSKKLVVNGNEYVFDEYGIMVMGFKRNREDVDWSQASNPTLKEKIKVYDKYEGNLLKNKWLREVTPEAYSAEDFEDGKEYWFYVDSNGYIVKNKITNISNNKYSFDGLGRLRKGFVLIDGIAFYGAEYKGEDLSKDDFIYSVLEGGHLYGSDLLDIHYFTEKEDENEGIMLTGNVNIELNDGTYEFCFKGNGIAIGNKNELKLHNNSYYRNGLKFVPWENTKYGIVKVKDDEYRVINSNGKIITGKRKLIKDDYGNYIVILNDRLSAYIKEKNRKYQLKWKTFNGITGYYYYDLDLEKKAYTGIAVASGTTCPTDAQINDIPDDLKVNFR